MPLPNLTYRIENAAPLTPGQLDNNFKILKGFVNGQEVLFLVSHETDGTLKASAVGTLAIGDLQVTEPKLADAAVSTRTLVDQSVTAVKLANAIAGAGLLKAANGDPLSVDVDNVTIRLNGSNKLEVISAAAAFVSTPISFPGSNSATPVAHPLTKRPAQMYAVLVCVTAENGYVANDEIDISSVLDTSSEKNAFAISADATSFYVAQTTTTNARSIPKGGGAFGTLTAANWTIKIYASP